jgi:hypothetical protein
MFRLRAGFFNECASVEANVEICVVFNGQGNIEDVAVSKSSLNLNESKN